MTTKVLNTRIALKRDKEANYLSTFIPLNGELLFVDTDIGLQCKIGDGKTQFANLSYINATVNKEIYSGYLFGGKFWTNSDYQIELPKEQGKIYIDLNSSIIYTYDGNAFKNINDMLLKANENTAGLVKLYNKLDVHEDGTMTQLSITNAFAEVKFDVTEDDTLILKTPIIGD